MCSAWGPSIQGGHRGARVCAKSNNVGLKGLKRQTEEEQLRELGAAWPRGGALEAALREPKKRLSTSEEEKRNLLRLPQEHRCQAQLTPLVFAECSKWDFVQKLIFHLNFSQPPIFRSQMKTAAMKTKLLFPILLYLITSLSGHNFQEFVLFLVMT